MKSQTKSSQQVLGILWAFSAMLVLGGVVAALVKGELADLLPGFWRICTRPSQFTMDYFKLGTLGGAFLNSGVVGLIVCLTFFVTGANCTGLSVAAYWLNVGFSTFGMNAVNVLPFILGTAVYAAIRKVKFGTVANFAFFSSALAPFASELLFRYPNLETVGFRWAGLLGAVILGIAVACVMPALCGHAPNIHKGYDLYSAGPAAGFLAFLVFCLLYKTVGIEVPTNTDLGDGERWFVTIFFIIVFGLCLLAAWLMDHDAFKKYKEVWKSDSYKVDFTAKYGVPAALVNMGVYGLFILLYYNVVQGMTIADGALVFTGAKFTGATMGAIMCMYAFVAQGANPKNVFPIMVGYALASLLPFVLFATGVTETQSWTLTTQGILVGLCFASGLAPVAGKWGFVPGVIAGALHAWTVTSVPLWHGGFCLYNGGFTCAIVAVLLVPVLEHYTKPLEERKKK